MDIWAKENKEMKKREEKIERKEEPAQRERKERHRHKLSAWPQLRARPIAFFPLFPGWVTPSLFLPSLAHQEKRKEEKKKKSTLAEKRQWPNFFNVDFIDLLCLKMPMIIVRDALDISS